MRQCLFLQSNHVFEKKLYFLTQAFGSGMVGRPMLLGLATMPDPGYLVMTNMPDFTNNKQKGQLCTSVVRREKRKKKHK
jgi:hypothetical protein